MRQVDETQEELDRLRRRNIRDAVLDILLAEGRPMHPKEVAQRLGIAPFAVSLAATNFPSYIARLKGKERGGRYKGDIAPHPHLRVGHPKWGAA